MLCDIKAINENFLFSRDKSMRKFLNFMVTYKRIKKIYICLGVSSNNWVKFLKIIFFIIDRSISKNKVITKKCF